MKHIILVSHGQFASGLKSAIGVVMGMADEITALGLEEGMDIKTFREKFLEILNQIPKEDEIILLCYWRLSIYKFRRIIKTGRILRKKLDLNRNEYASTCTVIITKR